MKSGKDFARDISRRKLLAKFPPVQQFRPRLALSATAFERTGDQLGY
jgi:hypothetical protein